MATAAEGVPPTAPAAIPDSPGAPVDVKDKVAIVTGSSRGIGAATALVLGKAGIKVVLAARSVGALEGVKAEIEAAGGTASVIKCDVTVASEVAAVFEHATKIFGGVDFVYANAGYEGNTTQDIANTADEEIFNVININIMGYMYTLKYAVKAFRARGGGAIAFTSSVGAILPRHMAVGDEAGGGLIKKVIPYGVSKAANDYIARAASSYTESDNIRSYGILPAAFETVMLQAIAKDHQMPNGTADMIGFNPFCGDQVGDPKHIGNVVLAMFDNTTKYETGETVVCDGDKTAQSELFYAQLNSVKPGGLSAYQYQPGPSVIRDYKGDVFAGAN